MSWTALIPLKACGERKTRLAGRLSQAERDLLTETLFTHVADMLHRALGKSSVVVLSASPPSGWSGAWIADLGRGLNIELNSLWSGWDGGRLAILHADLPLLSPEDAKQLLDAADRSGCAIAPDRHGTGTNALALAGKRDFRFGFGPDSFRRHFHAANGQACIVERAGLAIDIDTPADLDLAVAAGFVAGG